MGKFFAALLAGTALFSNPMLMLGAFMLAVSVLASVGAAVGENPALAATFTVLGLAAVWLTPFVVIPLAIVNRKPTGEVIGIAFLSILGPSAVVMIVGSFIVISACETGSSYAQLPFVWNPLSSIVIGVMKLVGAETGPLSLC